MNTKETIRLLEDMREECRIRIRVIVRGGPRKQKLWLEEALRSMCQDAALTEAIACVKLQATAQ
jgi:hypothetical protein